MDTLFLLLRKYRIGDLLIGINKNDLFPNIIDFTFENDKVFYYSDNPHVYFGQLKSVASVTRGLPKTDRHSIHIVDDIHLILPNLNLFSGGKTVSVPYLVEEDSDMRNQRLSFIHNVVENGTSEKEALEYSFYFVNNAYYGTRYKTKEDRLDKLLSL